MIIRLRKIIASIAAVTLTASSVIPGLSEAVFEPAIDEFLPEIAAQRLASPAFSGVSYSVPEFKRMIDSESDSMIPSALYLASDESISITDESAEMPSSFDLREYGGMTSVKGQGSNGTCWSFAAVASAETDLLKAVPYVDLSELHSAYYAYYGDHQIASDKETVKEIIDLGGNRDIIVNLWSQWIGPVSESVMPYENISAAENPFYAAANYEKSDYHLENAYMFDYTSDRSNFDNVNGLVKQFVYGGNAVDVSYYSNNTTAYNREEYAAFCTEKPKNANHSVVIAGWDDNFPASAFGEYKGSVPENDGAWLVKNSWGAKLGEYGYMWISYEDTSLCEFTVLDMSSSENYSTIYNHDTYVPAQTMSAGDDTEEKYASYMANVFTADQTEQIEAVSTYINNAFTDYEIRVYTGLADASKPNSGESSSVTRGTSELTGYITIELDENVVVNEGELFAVEVKLYNEDTNFVLPVETSMIVQDYESRAITELNTYSTFEQICSYTGKNESFYSIDGKNWYDVTDENYVYSDEEKEELIASMLELLEAEGEPQEVIDKAAERYRELFFSGELMVIMGNISLKAFGNPVNTVDFSHFSGAVSAEETVTLSVKSGEDIYYTVNGGAEILYDEPLHITEKTIISATADGKNYAVREFYPQTAEFNAIGYSTETGDKVNALKYAERIDESNYVISLSGDVGSIRLFPVSGAAIFMDGAEIESNMPTDRIYLDYGSNIVTFELSLENGSRNTVTLTIDRNAAEFNTGSETVKLYGDCILTASDGTVYNDGDSVSEYTGQILIADINGSEIEYKVPERALLPVFEIDFNSETLSGFSFEDALCLEYAVSGNDDYISAEDRLTLHSESGLGALKIIPGESLKLRIGAGNGKFAGEAVSIDISAAEAVPDFMPDYTEKNGIISLVTDGTVEYGLESTPLNEEEFAAEAEKFGYTAESFEELMLKRYGVSEKTELLKIVAAEWGITDVMLGEDRTAVLWVRIPASDNTFSSRASLIEISTDKYEKGDVNGDGIVNPADATLALSHYSNVSLNGGGILTPVQRYAADYDESGIINPVDATGILKQYVDESFN